ncbi:DUF1569 domain-containing protein [Granulicella paludicola]|uniref:DUF1569 domain-containing protein n=1 Tax=Granulicella paludicola TaxID=474951 RepID=UPI0021DF93C4|nr:DUF1569 domain-containing protein [Granulicella paludicola]
MKNLFDLTHVEELKPRLDHLQPDMPRLWGKMNAAQMLAHCAASMELALGDRKPKRMAIGRLLGRFIKSKAFFDEVPMRRNSPTIPGLAIEDPRDFNAERAQLLQLIDRFAAAGPAGCTDHPHAFFGALTPEEWSAWMYKHLDHHLRQFGV